MKAQSVHNAASRGDIQTLMQLIEEREVLLSKTAAGWTLLHTIAQHDHDKVACLFQDRYQLDPNAKASMKETPLHVCAIYGSSKVCDWLLSQGGEPDDKDDNGWTPIHYAARFGHQQVLEELRKEHRRRTEQRMEQERRDRASQRMSSRSRNAEQVDDDPAANRYTDPETTDGWTPLHVAARFEQVDIITYLLASAADKEAKDCQGLLCACARAWGWAARMGQGACAERAHADPGCLFSSRHVAGWTALHVAVRHGLTKVVTHLLNHRLDVDARTKGSESAGHIALKYRHVGIVDVLLNYGMNIETRDDKGETMLQSVPHTTV